jgi:hypothetical protein
LFGVKIYANCFTNRIGQMEYTATKARAVYFPRAIGQTYIEWGNRTEQLP